MAKKSVQKKRLPIKSTAKKTAQKRTPKRGIVKKRGILKKRSQKEVPSGRVPQRNETSRAFAFADVPFVPAFDLFDAIEKAPTPQELAAIAAMLIDLTNERVTSGRNWSGAARLEGLRD